MILHALKEYYDRKVADPDSDIAPLGWEWKEIPFVLVLDVNGKPVSLNSTVEGSGKTKRVKRFLVPQGVKKTSGVASNLLWENPEYAFGVVIKGKPERVAEQHQAFTQRVTGLGEIADQGLGAVKNFLATPDKAFLLQLFGEPWSQLLETGGNLTFQLAGDVGLVIDRSPVKRAIQAKLATDAGGTHSFCLVTGESDAVERLHAAIKGVWGAQTSGANIVSFNSDAFASFGKEQGANAPVGKSAAFAYTTALNHLLGKDSKQRLQVGDASTVFWSEKTTTFEQLVGDFFSEPPKDDPDRNTRAVESLFKAPQSGAMPTGDESGRFYVLGLAPNASRISIRFWIVNTVAGMAEKIRQHFKDVRITHGPKDRDCLPLWRLLVSTAQQGKSENVPPNLAGDTMRSILEGLPYPATLLQAAVRRNRAEQEVTYPRAAIIKACLNRESRFRNPTQLEELTVSLDPTNTSIGYRLGRLFATLEKIQEDANPGINATIRDRFYGAASGTPVTVFGNLIRLSQHHLGKMSDGLRITRERLLQEIMSGIIDFPAHLPLADQGRFAIGYYHQRQDFFTKKSDKE